MECFDVYPVFNICPKTAQGAFIYDENSVGYLDFYGGHAVISVGHNHPYFIQQMRKQLSSLPYYSNSVKIPQQKKLADKIESLSGVNNYALFLCNSGAEAIENALKLASFKNQRKG